MAKPSNVNMTPGGGGGRGVRGAMRGKKTSKGLAPTEYKGIEKLTTGKAKALSLNTILGKKIGRTTGEIKGILRASEPGKNTGLAKGKNKDFAKIVKKTTSPSATTSKRVKTPKVPVKPRGGRGMSGGAGLSIGKVR